jgi:hypothetical protein
VTNIVVSEYKAHGDLREENRRMKEAAKKLYATKEGALKLLVSTGMYTKKGKLKAQFR